MITKNAASHSLIIRPSGDLDALTTEHYRQSLRPLLEQGYRYIIVDFEETEFVTSSGLGLLVELHNAATRQSGTLRLINCSERVRWLLSQTRLDRVLLAGERNDEEEEDEANEDEPDFEFDSLHALMTREILFFSRINQAAERALKETDPHKIARLILKGMTTACNKPRGGFFFIDPVKRRFELAASRGLSDETVRRAASIDWPTADGPEWLNATEIRHRHPNDSNPADPFAALIEALEFERAVEAPVAGVDRPLAVVVLEENDDSGETRNFYHPLLKTFATICGLALEKSELLGRLQSQNLDLEETLQSIAKFQKTMIDGGKLAALGAVISGLGHMMNNKLVPIIGYTQLLAQTQSLPAKTLTQLETVNVAANELKDVMEKLIKVSKAREINRELVDVNEVLTRTVTLLGHHIESHRVHLDLSLGHDLSRIVGDHDLLLQGFLAIVHRACCSFGEEHEDRWIRIASRQVDSTLEIEFEDNGSGLSEMSEEEWLDPLVPYTELNQGRLFNYSIPRSVVRRHKGTLRLEEREGGGALVTVVLPVQRADYPGMHAVNGHRREDVPEIA